MMLQIHNVLGAEEIQHVRQLADAANWISGEHSAGDYARQVKQNHEMDQSSAEWAQINELVLSRLYQHPEFQAKVLPGRVSAAFVSRYSEGMGFGPHIDDAVMGTANGRYRSDIAVTVFLSEPDQYEGGELTVHTRFGPVAVKLPAGAAVAYPASSLHEVSTVTAGERMACVLWAQSLVRDPEQREILADLSDARSALQQSAPEAQVTQVVGRAYMNLVRMWSSP